MRHKRLLHHLNDLIVFQAHVSKEFVIGNVPNSLLAGVVSLEVNAKWGYVEFG